MNIRSLRHIRMACVVLGTAGASLLAARPLPGANVNAAFIANELSANETNPVFPGPCGGTLTLGYFGDLDNNAGTPDAFAAFLPGASPVGDHTDAFYASAFMQGFHKENPQDIPVTTVNTSGGPISLFGYLNIDPDQIFMHPGNIGPNAIVPPYFDAVVRYTVATPGSYDITGSFDSIDGGNTRNLVLLNENEVTPLFSQDESLGQPAAFSMNSLALAAGDHIDFVVDPGNGDVFGDSTGLSADIVCIPEPSTLSLLLIACALMLRRRNWV